MQLRLGILALIAIVCFGQGKQNVAQTGIVDAHAAQWIPPAATFASPPSSPQPGSVYIFTDATSVGTCSGGGAPNTFATCRWSGSGWQAVSGSGGSGIILPTTV